MTMPEHVAIIMDGNGRWATNRGWPRLVGHRRGAERVKQIVRQIAPDFEFLNEQMPTIVNIPDVCNAFADGFTINFFLTRIQQREHLRWPKVS